MAAPLLDLKIQNPSCATSQIYLDQVFGQNFDFCRLHRGRKVFLTFSDKVHSRLCYKICYTSVVILTMVTTIIMVVVVMVMMVVMVMTTISVSAYQYTSGGHQRP